MLVIVVLPTLRVTVCVNEEDARFVVTTRVPLDAGRDMLEIESVGFDFRAIVVRAVFAVLTSEDAGTLLEE